MIKNPKGTDFPQGDEGNSSEVIGKAVTAKASSTNANLTPWLRLKDPRIVRVSRVFGGKDRHSKVCTIRGLRDRRVRLSVPTAIQLYDLQDRLGLNQPSKVVDWLLNAAKHEIDELPPLPTPVAGNFSLLMTPRVANNAATASAATTTTTTTTGQSNDHDQGVLVKNNSDHSRSSFWSGNVNASSDALWRARSKDDDQKENLRGTRNINEVLEKEEGNETFLQRTTNMNHPFFPGMLNNISNSNNMLNSYRWVEPPNYPLLMSQLGGGSGGLMDHNNLHSLNVVSLQPSTLSLSTGSQLLLCPPSTSTSSTTSVTQSYFPDTHGMEIHDPRQAMSHFQMLSSNASVQNLLPTPMRSIFHFGTSNSTSNNGSSAKE